MFAGHLEIANRLYPLPKDLGGVGILYAWAQIAKLLQISIVFKKSRSERTASTQGSERIGYIIIKR